MRSDDRKARLRDWRQDGIDEQDPPLLLLSALNLLGVGAFAAAMAVFGFIVLPWLWGLLT